MNLLAVDAGNSRIKWGLHDGKAWIRQSWLQTTAAGAIGGELVALPPPDAIIASNVAGAAVEEALAAALAGFTPAVRWVRSEARQCGVTSSYDAPEQLGSDRWAALIGTWRLFQGPCVVVNVGTTMTVDALSVEGVFLGGFIVPGMDLMHESLTRGTARLKPQHGVFTYFPVSTPDAIMSGALNALVGAIERMLNFMAQGGQVAPLAVLSGGAATMVAAQLNARHELVDNLVLEGLLTIALSSE